MLMFLANATELIISLTTGLSCPTNHPNSANTIRKWWKLFCAAGL